MMTALRTTKWAARICAVLAFAGAAYYLARWDVGELTLLVGTGVLTTYVGWVLMPAQEDLQRILDRLHEFDRPRANDRYEWEQK